jgi:hypothetical protein
LWITEADIARAGNQVGEARLTPAARVIVECEPRRGASSCDILFNLFTASQNAGDMRVAAIPMMR